MREIRSLIEENDSNWKRRTRQEVERVKKEDKMDRQRVAKEKQKKFGKKLHSGKETKREKETKDEILKQKLELIELAEMKSNLWNNYREREGGKMKQVPVGWKVRKKKKDEKSREEEKILQEAYKALSELVEEFENWTNEDFNTEKEQAEEKEEYEEKSPSCRQKVRKRERSQSQELLQEETPSKLLKLTVNQAPDLDQNQHRNGPEKQKILQDEPSTTLTSPSSRNREIGKENIPPEFAKFKSAAKVSNKTSGRKIKVNPLSLKDEMSRAGQGTSQVQRRVKVPELVRNGPRGLDFNSTQTGLAEGEPVQQNFNLSQRDNQSEGSCQS